MTHDYEPPLGEFQPPDGPIQEDPEDGPLSRAEVELTRMEDGWLDAPTSRPALASGGTRCDRWVRIVMGTASVEDIAEARRQGEYITDMDGSNRRTVDDLVPPFGPIRATVHVMPTTEQEKKDKLLKVEVNLSPKVDHAALVAAIEDEARATRKPSEGTVNPAKVGKMRAVPQEDWDEMIRLLKRCQTGFEEDAAVIRFYECQNPLGVHRPSHAARAEAMVRAIKGMLP